MDNLMNTLEDLIDQNGLDTVMSGLEDVCRAKADHVAANWQDEELARRWEAWADIIGVATAKVRAS